MQSSPVSRSFLLNLQCYKHSAWARFYDVLVTEYEALEKTAAVDYEVR
jgi:hypothetical protein